MLLSPAFSGPNKKPILLYLYFFIINLIASLGVSIFFSRSLTLTEVANKICTLFIASSRLEKTLVFLTILSKAPAEADIALSLGKAFFRIYYS